MPSWVAEATSIPQASRCASPQMRLRFSQNKRKGRCPSRQRPFSRPSRQTTRTQRKRGVQLTTVGYFPGDTTLGVANVLLVFGALVVVELSFMPFCTFEFVDPPLMPLSELVAPGIP